MTILNIAGYQFITLTELDALRASLQQFCLTQKLKGTILLSVEGININLAGEPTAVDHFVNFLQADSRFTDISFHRTYSALLPFKQLKIKIKKEIITLRQDQVQATVTRAPSIDPETLKLWLDEERDITLLDVRNDFEIEVGKFNRAVNLHMNQFNELPAVIAGVDRNKPVVMYCTGGIRCEKAALYMLDQGYTTVYQLDGGILGYFARVGQAHYSGECFVFDERITVAAQQ